MQEETEDQRLARLMEEQKWLIALGTIETVNDIVLSKIEEDGEEPYYRLFHKPSGHRIPGDYYRLDYAKGCLAEIAQLKIPPDGHSMSEELKNQAREIIDKWQKQENSWPLMTAEGRWLFESIQQKTPLSIQRAIAGWVWTYEDLTNGEAFDSPELALFNWIEWASNELSTAVGED